jgi:hypothetical protein
MRRARASWIGDPAPEAPDARAKDRVLRSRRSWSARRRTLVAVAAASAYSNPTAGGFSDGTGGILGTPAAANAEPLRGLGVYDNSDPEVGGLFSTFDDRPVNANVVRVEYTIVGDDADLDGQVNNQGRARTPRILAMMSRIQSTPSVSEPAGTLASPSGITTVACRRAVRRRGSRCGHKSGSQGASGEVRE